MAPMGSMAGGLKRCLSQMSMLAFKASTSGEEAWLHTWSRCCASITTNTRQLIFTNNNY